MTADVPPGIKALIAHLYLRLHVEWGCSVTPILQPSVSWRKLRYVQPIQRRVVTAGSPAFAARAPDGYIRFRLRGVDVVARREHTDSVREMIALSHTLYEYAARHPGRRRIEGRVPAYAVTLPDGTTSVVVRHSHHGGLLAGITRDRFLAPTRAPQELSNALRLAALAVPTPMIVAYAGYPAGPWLRRSDIVTLELMPGKDLAAVLMQPLVEDDRRRVLQAVAELLRTLDRAGARHPDLNVKNVFLVNRCGAWHAYVLDVDRVVFGRTGDARITEANLRRFLRSARKWRDRYSVQIDESDLTWLVAAVTRHG